MQPLRQRGPDWTPITPKTGSLFHADPHVIYLAALSAMRHNPDLARFYERLSAAGKAKKVAITAVARKLLILANALVTQDRLWQATPPNNP